MWIPRRLRQACAVGCVGVAFLVTRTLADDAALAHRIDGGLLCVRGGLGDAGRKAHVAADATALRCDLRRAATLLAPPGGAPLLPARERGDGRRRLLRAIGLLAAALGAALLLRGGSRRAPS